MTFTDGLAVSAIILAVVAIGSEILFFIVQTDRAAKSQREISDYVGQMREVLGEIKGLTTGTREQQQEQFKWLLQVAVGEERASVARELGEGVAAVKDSLAGVGGGLSPEAKQQFDSVMEDLKREVGTLAKDIESLRKSAPRQPPPAALRGAGTPFLDSALEGLGLSARVPTVLPTGLGEDILFVSIEPLVVEPGGSVRMRQVVAPFIGVTKGECEVRTPDGRSLSAPWLSSSITLVFPDDFPYASTELPGEYSVTVRRQELFSPTASPREAVFRGAFRVCSLEPADD